MTPENTTKPKLYLADFEFEAEPIDKFHGEPIYQSLVTCATEDGKVTIQELLSKPAPVSDTDIDSQLFLIQHQQPLINSTITALKQQMKRGEATPLETYMKYQELLKPVLMRIHPEKTNVGEYIYYPFGNTDLPITARLTKYRGLYVDVYQEPRWKTPSYHVRYDAQLGLFRSVATRIGDGNITPPIAEYVANNDNPPLLNLYTSWKRVPYSPVIQKQITPETFSIRTLPPLQPVHDLSATFIGRINQVKVEKQIQFPAALSNDALQSLIEPETPLAQVLEYIPFQHFAMKISPPEPLYMQ